MYLYNLAKSSFTQISKQNSNLLTLVKFLVQGSIEVAMLTFVRKYIGTYYINIKQRYTCKDFKMETDYLKVA